jgi:hypothetical protein
MADYLLKVNPTGEATMLTNMKTLFDGMTSKANLTGSLGDYDMVEGFTLATVPVKGLKEIISDFTKTCYVTVPD